eukprot:CAMPEP_0168367352 /NCGR_PEP_ID=MMETSP0228-20121227/5696_1 /TAXON_ID=133427 /ORGANISM="Protoceratium reticulatum, Strain CCCM 535 (=CCMP 1889)" /LENGTH=87 /DNA_ID=CAMNT_0008380175 /DNA_START=507 /DNA_END=767 /DNA_ORIENTATION=+
MCRKPSPKPPPVRAVPSSSVARISLCAPGRPQLRIARRMAWVGCSMLGIEGNSVLLQRASVSVHPNLCALLLRAAAARLELTHGGSG